MPELAMMFLMGAVLSLITGALFTFQQMRFYKSFQFLTLQKNLQHIGLRWNDINSEPEDFSEGRQQKEIARARFSCLLFTFFAVFLSWFGFFLLLMLWVSLKVLVKSRLEKRIYQSELVLKEFDSIRVNEIWQSLNN